jgi:hypothetical protein
VLGWIERSGRGAVLSLEGRGKGGKGGKAGRYFARDEYHMIFICCCLLSCGLCECNFVFLKSGF